MCEGSKTCSFPTTKYYSFNSSQSNHYQNIKKKKKKEIFVSYVVLSDSISAKWVPLKKVIYIKLLKEIPKRQN